MKTSYTCQGSVRGDCGIKHRTREAAEAHCEADRQSVRKLNSSGSLTRSYSDREVKEIK
jgi:hypothetical protein